MDIAGSDDAGPEGADGGKVGVGRAGRVGFDDV